MRGMQRVREHAPTGERVQHLGCLGPHSGSGSGGENDDGGLLWHGSPSAAGHRVLESNMRGQRYGPARELRRQDSNLDKLNQNQLCCHYTTADCSVMRV
ncbi:hypothetical protein NSK11_contig00072-0026 [Nocardia seriolae]|uniref:Uncharacterized protein n=1 Tax=Nocardia seriolae TaxID=37332 RepID=A0ABC9YX62_9NOCA|nr:hypothetical protein NS07_v2contig00067-0026 [Nocardia seriolae]GAP30103.1 hypothetical protein NSK11_contig00072-0026 [Nocardia seriolae]